LDKDEIIARQAADIQRLVGALRIARETIEEYDPFDSYSQSLRVIDEALALAGPTAVAAGGRGDDAAGGEEGE
jgi:hypothetical protein